MLGGLVLGLVQPVSAEVPKPSVVPRGWQLGFEFQDLERITVVLPGDKHPTTFWYLLYTVTNNTGADVEFYPSFHLVTETLRVVDGGDSISPSVYDAITSREKKSYPFFRNPLRMCGKLLQGPDNARISAAVFRDFDPEANSFTVYVAGLSGEIIRLSNPAFDPGTPETHENPRFFVLRKTLAISYDLPGDPETRRGATPVRRGTDWVMR